MKEHSAINSGEFRKAARGLADGAETIKSDVTDLAHGAADAARAGVSDLRHGAEQMAGAAKETLGNAKDSALAAADSAKGAISRNPVLSVGIAAAVGMLIGLFLARGKD